MTDDNKHWYRRSFVGASAGALTTLVAGCQDNSSNATPSETTGGSSSTAANNPGGGELRESVYDFVGGRTPTEIQLNPWNLANFGHTYSLYVTTGLATGYADGTVSSDYLEDMSVDGKDLDLTFPTGWTYWNGRDLKAKDFYIQEEINRLQDPEASPYSNVELADEQTVRITFKNQVTPKLMKARLVTKNQITPRWIYEDYLERYQDASGQDERDDVTRELQKMTISVEQFANEGLGNGIYEIEKFNSAETVLTPYQDHPWADRTNLGQTKIVPVGGNTDSLAKNDELDRVSYIRESERPQYPENLQNQRKVQWFRTQKYILNWKNEHLGKRPVRRALISAIDLESITAAARRYMAEPTQVQTGLRSSIHDQYLGSDFTDSLIEYPVGSDADAAAAYMEEAGYSKQGGTWTSSDGETVTLNVLTRDNAGQAQPTKVLSDQLNEFGIETNMNAIGEDYYTKLQEWSFDIGWVWHVAKALWHPTAYYSNDFYGVLAGDPTRDGPGPTGVPKTVTIPEEVGAETVDGSGKEIDPSQIMADLPSSSSEQQVKERTKTLSQWFNYDLPAIVYMQENTGYAGDAENFTFPGEDKKMDMNYPGRGAWVRGWISGKTE